MDLELCQISRLYVHALANYNKTVLQRNKLLKELPFHPEYEKTLDVWDEQLIYYGIQVIRERQQFASRLNSIIGGDSRKPYGKKGKIGANL